MIWLGRKWIQWDGASGFKIKEKENSIKIMKTANCERSETTTVLVSTFSGEELANMKCYNNTYRSKRLNPLR